MIPVNAESHIAYVDENRSEFEKIKFCLDVIGGGWVRAVYYNPDSDAGGQLVYNLLSNRVIAEAGKTCADEENFWTILDSEARQTLADVGTHNFLGYAEKFVDAPCDLMNQGAETMKKLIQWANDSLKTEEESA